MCRLHRSPPPARRRAADGRRASSPRPAFLIEGRALPTSAEAFKSDSYSSAASYIWPHLHNSFFVYDILMRRMSHVGHTSDQSYPTHFPLEGRSCAPRSHRHHYFICALLRDTLRTSMLEGLLFTFPYCVWGDAWHVCARWQGATSSIVF
jgi:hypothetical protein